MINTPLSFTGKMKQLMPLIVGRKFGGHFTVSFNWKGGLKASNITSIGTSVFSYSPFVTSIPVQYFQSSQITVSETGISLDRGQLYFLFSRISRESTTCTCWFLKSSLTRRVLGHINKWISCSCSKVSWGSLKLGGKHWFSQMLHMAIFKRLKTFFGLFVMLGNPSVSSLCKETFRCGS